LQGSLLSFGVRGSEILVIPPGDKAVRPRHQGVGLPLRKRNRDRRGVDPSEKNPGRVVGLRPSVALLKSDTDGESLEEGQAIEEKTSFTELLREDEKSSNNRSEGLYGSSIQKVGGVVP